MLDNLHFGVTREVERDRRDHLVSLPVTGLFRYDILPTSLSMRSSLLRAALVTCSTGLIPFLSLLLEKCSHCRLIKITRQLVHTLHAIVLQ